MFYDLQVKWSFSEDHFCLSKQCCIIEGLDGGSGIHYSLKILPIFHLIKILGYSLK